MKRMISRIAIAVLCLWLLPQTVFGARELIPVGEVVGLELQNGTVTVAGLDEQLGSAAKAAGLQVGDVLLRVDDTVVRSAEDVRRALARSAGRVTLVVRRGDGEHSLQFAPRITADGPKLGAYLKQGITGIGTVTWYDPDTGEFATLGHGVNGPDGKLVSMTEGNAYDARVLSVRKGRSGEPGQLMGAVERAQPIGSLTANTVRGVFGTTGEGWLGRELPVAEAGQIRTGEATILSTVSGDTVREYSVQILKIYPKAKRAGRNLLIKVTDPALLEATGGIVQGMSGSPLVQDGKLIGAVTHVLVNDPTMGYGIFIENMLEAAG